MSRLTPDARGLLVGLVLLAAIAGANGLHADPLTVGEIRIESTDVFAPEELARARGLDRLLRNTMNALHIDTAAWVVRKELLFAPGDPFDPQKLEETARNLRQLGILADVAVTPADTTADGRVAVRVRYRESWTLSAGLSFAIASDGSARGNVSLTERNFLGQGVVLQGLLGRDEDATYGRIYFRQDRFLRSDFALELNVEQRSFGYDRWGRVAYPFRADDQPWSAQVQTWTDEKEVRWYLSHADVPGADPADPRSLHALLPRQTRGVEARFARRVSRAGEGRIWRLGAGLRVLERDYALGDGWFWLSDDTAADLSGLAADGTPMARSEGTSSWPYLWLASHGRRWTTGRYILNYGSHEDIPLDLRFELQSGPVLPDLGWQSAGAVQDWTRIGGSFAYWELYGEGALGGREPRPARAGVLGGVMLHHGEGDRPRLTRVAFEAAAGRHLNGDQSLILGLDRGLRTLDLDGMAGDRLVRWNVEHGRPLPLVLLGIFQTGWAAYYGGGLARFEDEARDLGDARHEAGVGLRFGSLRSSTADLARLDVSWRLDGGGGPVVTTVARGFF